MRTCDLLHRVEDFQFFRIKGWHFVVDVALNKSQ